MSPKKTIRIFTFVIIVLISVVSAPVIAVPLVEDGVEEMFNQTDRNKVNILFAKNITPEGFVESFNMTSEDFEILYITYSRTAAHAMISKVGFEELKKRDEILGIGKPTLFRLTNSTIETNLDLLEFDGFSSNSLDDILKELNECGSVLVEILLHENVSQDDVISDLKSKTDSFPMIQKQYAPRSLVANITVSGLEILTNDSRVSRINLIRSTNLYLGENRQTGELLLRKFIWIFVVFIVSIGIWLLIKKIKRSEFV